MPGPRIIYLTPYAQVLSGGTKMVYRHVEALNAMGFDAVVRRPAEVDPPGWFRHEARSEDMASPLRPDDILVLPEDAPEALIRCAPLPNPKVIFCQSLVAMPAFWSSAVPREVQARYRTFLTGSEGMAAFVARHFDYDLISVVPVFADERLFRPGPKARLIACSPRKRPYEQRAIRYMFERLHPDAAGWRWEILETETEARTAEVMGRASVFLSLARMESTCLTNLEAMASECLMTGFTGVGPREYASPVNGIWVDEDDCEAAAHALSRACALADAGGGAAALMRHAARTTAARWTYAGFRERLASFWRDRMGVTA
ncbi:hypothetical protein [Phenylobacterium sp. SCN 70-31]|uniref:hypothetical protein n=1 Tax=Phenylobacterium sp. SCN 70-31 TaxID=1660129 RepID=UPI00086D9050|nr:hypothetical protein [Phenylobacterium sp. SCN 70-31]ODT87247.1 MAG: hypothetical protein ABS78_12580 [Phenylobacterium sp. SCN 70-31]